MPDFAPSNRGTRLLVSAAALVIIGGGIYQAQAVLVSLLVSIFLAILATPPIHWLERRGVPTIAAVLLVLAGMVLLLLASGAVIGASISGFSEEVPAYQARMKEQVTTLLAYLSSKGVRGLDKVLRDLLNPSMVMGLTARLLAELGAALSNILLVLLTIAFILFEAASFPGKLRSILGDPLQSFPQFNGFIQEIERYVVIKSLIGLATGLLVGAWLWFLGVDFFVLWGFLAFLLNFIPSIGSTLASVPAILLALVQLGPGSAALASLGYMAANFTLDYLVEPRLMGQRLHLSTLVVFLSLIFWGSLLGPVGMVLCIPLTMTLKFACENGAGTRWIAVLLGDGQAEPARATLAPGRGGAAPSPPAP